MPDVLTLHISEADSFAGSTVADLFSGIKTLIDDHSIYHTVTDIDTVDAHLEIAPNHADVANARILLCGGQTPNAAAVGSGVVASSSYIYAGTASNVGSAGPDQSYSAGAPYTGAGDAFTGLTQFGSGSNIDYTTLRLWETEETLGIMGFDGTALQSTINAFCIYGGAIGLKLKTAEKLYGVMCNGIGQIAHNWWTAAGDNNSLVPGESSPGGTAARGLYLDGTVSTRWYRGPTHIDGAANLRSADNLNGITSPILMMDPQNGATVGFLRQIGWGPDASFGFSQNDDVSGDLLSTAISGNLNHNVSACWFKAEPF